MNREEIITTLETLAAQFPNTPTAAALTSATTLIKEHDCAALARGRKPNPNLPAAGLRWTADEDARLANEFDSGMSVAQIALAHGRTSGGITLRLVKLGRIDPSTVPVRERGGSAERTH
jgi:hypothetical protein